MYQKKATAMVKGTEMQPGEIFIQSNDNKHGNQPDFWGWVVDSKGQTLRVALWKRTRQDGKAYLKGQITHRDPAKRKDGDPFNF